MESYLIVKGINKFINPNKISKNNSIDLVKLKKVTRIGETSDSGISSNKFGLYWFLTPKGRALFKTFDYYLHYNVRELRIINELVCMELLKLLNIPCVQYEPAYFNLYDGLVSYDITGENEKIIPLYKLFGSNSIKNNCNLESVSYFLDRIKQEGYKFSKKDFILSMYTNSVFDFIVKQMDRHYNNINCIVDDDKNLRYANIMDNEFAFISQYFSGSVLTHEEEKYCNLLSYYDDYAPVISLNGVDSKNKLNGIVTDIVNCAKSNKDMNRILNHIINNFNIDKAIELVEQNGILISNEYKEYMKNVCKDSISHLLSKMEQNEDYDSSIIETLY